MRNAMRDMDAALGWAPVRMRVIRDHAGRLA